MPTYIVLRIGCLCCDTPTSIVGFYKNEEKAFDIIEKCEKINTSSRHEYQLHVIDDTIDEYESKHLKRVLSFYESKKENNEGGEHENDISKCTSELLAQLPCTKYMVSHKLLD